MTPPTVLVVKRGSVTSRDIRYLRRNGVSAVEIDDLSNLKHVTLGDTNELLAVTLELLDDKSFAWRGAVRESLGKRLIERLVARTRKETP